MLDILLCLPNTLLISSSDISISQGYIWLQETSVLRYGSCQVTVSLIIMTYIYQNFLKILRYFSRPGNKILTFRKIYINWLLKSCKYTLIYNI